jgi:flagellar hook-associated protein 1 FlgK
MGSTFSGLEVAKKGLSVHQQALHTTGHNISNADSKTYARQRVQITSAEPLYDASLNRAMVAGQIGQGSQVPVIERVRDAFIDDRIVETNSNKEYWATKNDYLYRTEMVFNEPTGLTLRTQLDQFWSSWQELANYPDESAHRSVVKEKAIALGTRIEDTFRKLTQLQNQSNEELKSKVDLLNVTAESIRHLNEKIVKAEALGDRPNDLYDKRDALVEDLAGLVNVSIGRSDKDEFMVFIGEEILVQGSKREKIETIGNPENEGKVKLIWERDGRDLLLKSGKILALQEIRDVVLKEKIAGVDSFAINLVDTVNEIHKDGFGLNGRTNINFFQPKDLSQNTNAEYDFDGDGVLDRTAIFRVTGKTSLDGTKPIGIAGTITLHQTDEKSTPVLIPYNVDDTVNDVITRINRAQAGVVSFLNHDNQLVVKATLSESNSRENFMIRHLEDSGNFLVGLSGILNSSGGFGSFDYRKINELNKLQGTISETTFTPFYHPASFVRVSDDIQTNLNNIAASRGKDVGGTGDYNKSNGAKDGSNALLISSFLKDKPMMVEYDSNFTEFYSNLISKLGTEAREAKQEMGIQTALLSEFEKLRQSVMGVNLDEEMANMVQFQHSYNAAAKMINIQNEMLDTLINRMGL